MAEKVDWLITCLGNPGKVYSKNRHNIGWMVASALCERFKKPIMQMYPKFYHATIRIRDDLVLVILPVTYMNNSGEAVAYAKNHFEISTEKIVLVCDEYNFPLGKVHLKFGGSNGGHNGVASVIESLNTSEFFRLRCGIGKNFPQGGMVDYVLSDFKKDEHDERDTVIKKAVDSIEYLILNGKTKAMTDINSDELWYEDLNDVQPDNL